MSRSPVMISARPPASTSASANAPEQVVGLQVIRGRGEPAEGGEQLRGVLELPVQRVGHRRAVGVVGGIQLGPVGGGLGAEADDDRPRAAVGGDPQDQVDGAQQRVDGVAVGVGDRVRQREERAIQDERAVDREQRSGHAPEAIRPRLQGDACPAAQGTVTAGPSSRRRPAGSGPRAPACCRRRWRTPAPGPRSARTRRSETGSSPSRAAGAGNTVPLSCRTDRWW